MSAPCCATDKIEQHAKAATSAMKAKNWEAAATDWLHCLELQGDETRPEHLAQLIACNLALKQYPTAKQLLEHASLRHPFSTSLLLHKAALAYLERDYRDAIQNWCLCMALEPDSMTQLVFKRLGVAFRRLGYIGHGKAIISNGLQRFPNAASLWVEMAIAEETAGQLEIAGGFWEKALENYGGLAPASVCLSACLVLAKNGQLQRCVEILEAALLIHPDDKRLQGRLKEVRIANRVDVSIVAESDGKYRFTYYKQRQEASVIFFTFGTILNDLTSRAFGYPFLTLEGYDHVHVAQGSNQQYQELSLEAFAAIAAPLCAGKKAFTYGSSLGGYAAIYFASAIRACAIASSPTLPAHAMAKRFPNHKIPIKHIPIERFEIAERVYAFFDPHDEDDEAFMRERIAQACKDLVSVPLPFSGHQALKILKEAGLLKQTIRQIVADMPTAITIGEDQFDNTVIYLAKKASYLHRKGQYGEAIEVGKKCIALTPSLHAYNALISSALRLGQLDVAVRHYEDALAYFPANKLVRLPKTTRNLPSPYAQ